MADVRVRRPAHAPRAGMAPTAPAVPRALAAQGSRGHRVSALRRLWPGLRRPAEGALLRGQRTHGEGHLDQALSELRRGLADDPQGDRLPALHARASLPETRHGRARVRDRVERPYGARVLASRRRVGRVVAADRRPQALLRLLGPPPLRVRTPWQTASAAPLDLHRGRPDRGGARACGPHGLHRDEQRHRLRRRRAQRPAALAGDVVLPLRPPGVLLCHADRRLRARLHRERRRDGVRLRRRHRPSALGAAGRHLRLHGRRGLAEDHLRRNLGRLLRRAGRPHRGHPLALQRARLDHGGADRACGARLLLDLRALRRGWPATGQDRPARDVGSERAQRPAGLAVPRREVLAGRRRRLPDLRRRAKQGLRAHSRAPLATGAESEGPRKVRSAEATKSASAMPVKGHTRYEFWKTRLTKRRT